MEIKVKQLYKLINKYSENIYYPFTGLVVTAPPIVMFWPSTIVEENRCRPLVCLWIALVLFALFSMGCLVVHAMKWSNQKIHEQIVTHKKRKSICEFYNKLFSQQIWDIVCRLINNGNTPIKLSKSQYEEFDNRNLFGEDRPLQKDKQRCIFVRHTRNDDGDNEKTEKEIYIEECFGPQPFSGSRYISLTDLSFYEIRKTCFHRKGKKWILNKNILRKDE
jgi:hypothetical protein